MKKLLYILIVLFTQKGVAQDAFRKSNDLYSEGKYTEAAAGYESILKQGKESAEVYFNLGNAYYKSGRVAPSIYNYEKALQLDPGEKDILVNLGYARKMVIDDITAPKMAGFSGWLTSAAGKYHYDTWGGISVCLSVAFLLFFCGYYFTKTAWAKRGFFVGMGLTLGGIIIAFLAGQFIKSADETERPAIVFAKVAVAKTRPAATAEDAFIAHEGFKVFVLEDRGDWKKVVLQDDTAGWLQGRYIKEL